MKKKKGLRVLSLEEEFQSASCLRLNSPSALALTFGRR